MRKKYLIAFILNAGILAVFRFMKKIIKKQTEIKLGIVSPSKICAENWKKVSKELSS